MEGGGCGHRPTPVLAVLIGHPHRVHLYLCQWKRWLTLSLCVFSSQNVSIKCQLMHEITPKPNRPADKSLGPV